MPSNFLFPLLACFRKEKIDTDRSSFLEIDSSFLDNGNILLEDLIASCDGKSNPIRNYSADELIRATNNFDPSGIMQQDSSYEMFHGFLDNRPVIIKKYFNWLAEEDTRSMAIRDIVISTQMSSHKNVLKLLGCCLEFPIPALVHEYAAKGVLNFEGGYGDNESLPWKARLRIAKQFANAIAYLHTAFPRPIILRDLKPNCIFLDDDYVPKLCSFAISITIPPLQSHVVDVVIGTPGYFDPTYLANSSISLKTDVYSFGILLLVFLTGRQALHRNRAGEYEYLIPYVKSHACSGQIQTIMDPKISVEVGGADQAHQQFHDFLALALLCIRDESEARPDMIDVAKELVRIEKLGCTSN